MVTAVSDTSDRRALLALTSLAFLAPFNVKITTDAWTDLQLRMLVVIALIVLIVLAVRSLRVSGSIPGEARWRVPDRVDAVAYVWLTMIWISAFASDDLALGSGGAVRLSVAILLIPVCRSVVQSRADATLVLRAMGFGTAIGACIGLAIWLWGAELDATRIFVGKVTSLGAENRLTRPWAHANVAAMAMGAAVASTVLLPRRWMRIVASTLVVVAIVLTISRGGLVAMGSAGVAWIMLRRRGPDAMVIAGLAVIAAVVFTLSSAWATRVAQLGDEAFYASRFEAVSSVTVGGVDDAVDVTVTNLSTVEWPRLGEDRVLISARWIGDDGLVWTEDRWQLPRDLEPGETVATGLTIGPRVPDGVYELRWDLLIADVAYFGQFLGDEPVVSSATVVNSTVEPDDNFRYTLVQRDIGLGRVDTWRLAWDDFVSSPLLGVGPSQFGDRVTLELAEDGRAVGAHAHNIVLEPLAAWGLLGAVPFLVLGVGAVWRAVGFAWRTREMVDCVVAVGLVAVVVHGTVDWPLVVVTTGIPVGILIGLAWTGSCRT